VHADFEIRAMTTADYPDVLALWESSARLQTQMDDVQNNRLTAIEGMISELEALS